MSRVRTLHAFDPKRFGPLPAQQQKALDYIRAVVAASGKFPSLREIADHMGWRVESSALDCLCRLQWRGRVVREPVSLGQYQWKLTPAEAAQG